VPLVVGVAGGTSKAECILGALRTGYLNVLIADERSAQKVLALAADATV
jgi:DNA-binding transcriptional regulator LsrR (DeoR family)